jgi:Retroviral aspartyl protease
LDQDRQGEIYTIETKLSEPIRTTDDYRPELVIAIPKDPSNKTKTFLRALVDSGSNQSHANIEKIPNWIIKQATINSPENSFIGWGSEFKPEKVVELPFIMTQFAPNRKINHKVHLSTVMNKTSTYAPDMIIGRDIIRKLGLNLNFYDEIPVISWNELSVPMVKRGFWITNKLQETFHVNNKTTLEKAEENFEGKSPSMLAANYKSTSISEMIPIHLSAGQKQQLTSVLQCYEELFIGKLGLMPGKPVHLELIDKNIKPYHGKAYPVPQSMLKIFKEEINRLCHIGAIRKTTDSEWAAQGFAVPKKNGEIRFVTDFRWLNKNLRRCPFPLPSIQEIMRTVEGLSWITVLDLVMGFWHILLDEESQKLTAFVLP